MEAENAHILIVEDDAAVCISLKLLLKRAGFQAVSIQRPQELEGALQAQAPDLVLLDMNFAIETSGRQGLRLLQQLLDWKPGLPVILMTAWATVQLAVEGMKLGAKDFVAKPWDNKQLLSSIRTLLSLQGPQSELPHMVGEDPAFLETLAVAKRISTTDASVLVLGESGTGKEVLAEAIHYQSDRNQGPFVRVNLGGINSSLFESELFGHKKGAFTDAITER